MGMGTPGDEPLVDLQVHGLHPFPADVESILIKVLAICPTFPDDRRVCTYYAEQVEWADRIRDLTQRKRVAETKLALENLLGSLTSNRNDGG